MITVLAGQANTVGVDIIDPQSTSGGGGVEVGTVDIYLIQRRGDNAGQYWDGVAGAWSATATSCGQATHESKGHWTISIPEAAWVSGDAYRLYGVLDGGSYVSHSIDILCVNSVASWAGSTGDWPVTLAELKAHLRIDSADTTEDQLLDAYLGAATRWAEKYRGEKFLSQTCVETFDAFPRLIQPAWSPLIAVTSIQYIDSAGSTQTLATSLYQVDTVTRPGRIAPAYGESWPATRSDLNAVTLTYTAGYGSTGDDVPEEIRNAVMMLVHDLYENRGEIVEGHIVSVIPIGVKALLGIDRRVWV